MLNYWETDECNSLEGVSSPGGFGLDMDKTDILRVFLGGLCRTIEFKYKKEVSGDFKKLWRTKKERIKITLDDDDDDYGDDDVLPRSNTTSFSRGGSSRSPTPSTRRGTTRRTSATAAISAGRRLHSIDRVSSHDHQQKYSLPCWAQIAHKHNYLQFVEEPLIIFPFNICLDFLQN